MAQIELILPKMGESITEATILKWTKKVGDKIDQDETVLEIATDKVDSEVPASCAGVLTKILFEENAIVPVGTCIAYIETDVVAQSVAVEKTQIAPTQLNKPAISNDEPETVATTPFVAEIVSSNNNAGTESGRFYSPLVKTIAKEENISFTELERVAGSGEGGRITKTDLLNYVKNRSTSASQTNKDSRQSAAAINTQYPIPNTLQTGSISGGVEIIEMDRMRQMIAKHMTDSLQISPHVTSFVEVDVTNIVNWRNKIKAEYQKKYNENITYTPIFIEAVCAALRDFPWVNASVEGTKIIVKKDLNIGMAAAIPNGNLIVPVIKGAHQLNLQGLTQKVNDLSARARANKLKPDDVQGGTFTLTNVGTFGSVMGTPIINQPQVAILATGVIKKKPAVMETEYGDVIAIRQMMFLSLSYDHRIVDGAMGSSFLRRVADLLEKFDTNRTI